MEEKEKKPWRPPEAAHLPDPIAFAMQGFERFGLPKERLIPPLQTFDRVMQHSAFTENRWWENARQVTATSSAEQWRRVSIERARCLGEPWPDFDDIPVASITEDFSQKCQNATIGLLRDQVIASCAIPGETSFRDIFNQLGIKEDNMDSFIVSNMRSSGENVELRIVSERQPVAGAENVESTLEDAYLYHTQITGGEKNAAL